MDNSTAVIVNGESIGVRDLLHGMKVRQGAQFLEAAIQDALIRQAAGKDAKVSDEELQAAADELRRSMGLFDSETTHQWLKQSGISVEDLEGGDPSEAEASEILDLVRSLPEAYRETLLLRLVEGMTGPEIARRTGLTPGSVRVNLHRGMTMLREKLKGSREEGRS